MLSESDKVQIIRSAQKYHVSAIYLFGSSLKSDTLGRDIDLDLMTALDEYRAFRHFFVHGYGILLQEAPLQPLAQNLPEVWNRVQAKLQTFLDFQNT